MMLISDSSGKRKRLQIDSDMRLSKLWVTGSNSVGQFGISFEDDRVLTSIEVNHVDADQVLKIVTTQHQTYVILRNGVLMTAGENDHNELCRSGKRSYLSRCDMLETFQIIDASGGSNFATVLNKDGRLISWGMNDMGQLGNGTRDNNFKPRVNTSITEAILQISSGSQHTVVLTKSGDVLTYGGNKRGQLGSGQLTSSTVPTIVSSLRHKPVISISCGENHTLVLTSGGNVYSWGDNSQGQLGQGQNDTTHRLRPEIMKSMRNIKTTKIATGGQHSLLLASTGLVFTRGSNSHGQCGLSDTEVRVQTVPVVIQRLSELKAVELICGRAHSIVICKLQTPLQLLSSMSEEEGKSEDVMIYSKAYVMGLNSSGQLGLGHSSNVFTPTVLPLSQTHNVLKAYSGPMSMHTFFLTGAMHEVRSVLPSVDYESISSVTETYKSLHTTSSKAPKGTLEFTRLNQALTAVREMIATAFSSISILNASFLADTGTGGSSATSGGGTSSTAAQGHTKLAIDLPAVRASYNTIMSTEPLTPLIVNTLGRATLHTADQLRQCPVDDVENLSVYLILLENPLMLRPVDFHVVIEVIVSSILSLPNYYRVLLFKWLKVYPSEYLGRVLQVLQGFLSFIMTSKQTNLNPASVVLVLETLYQCNVDEDILPEHLFYNTTLTSRVNILDEWRKHKEAGPTSHVFNFCQYPFLLDDVTKYKIIQYDFHTAKSIQAYKHMNKYMSREMKFDSSTGRLVNPEFFGLPSGLMIASDPLGTVALFVQIEVRRDNIVADLFKGLRRIKGDDADTLRLPLRVAFTGEIGVDMGGITKELFTLAIRNIVQETRVLAATASGRHLWFTRAGCTEKNGSGYSCEYLLGLLVGLAAYNGVYVDLPLPSFIYKIISGRELALSDLWDVDADLARGLTALLEFDEGAGAIEEVFGATFTASLNPLLSSAVHVDVASGVVVSSPTTPRTPGKTPRQTSETMVVVTDSSVGNGSENIPPDTEVVSTQPTFVELQPEGSEKYVNRVNRSDFVKAFLQHALYVSCKPQIDDYIRGCRFLFDGPAVKLCTHRELEHMLCGSRDIGDLSELRLKTTYKGVFHDEHPVINWFWDVLSSLSLAHKKKFLQFVTGSERIPLGGISNLGLVIQSSTHGETSLPTSHTCFNILDLSANYASKEQLKERFLLAIENCEGFGLV